MITFLKNVFRKGELRQKIIFTLGVLFVFRLGTAITIPGVNIGSLSNSDSSGIFGLMNMIGGGQLERFSLFALGVSPYITSSIIIELLSMDVIPTLSQWSKEGNTGKKKKDRVTRYVTLALAAFQGGALTYTFDQGYNILNDGSIFGYLFVVLVMIAGSMLTIWLGDQITNKGIGNGVSLLIFTGIVSSLPSGFITTFNSIVDFSKDSTTAIALDIAWYVLFVIVYLAIVLFVVFNEGATRKIPVMYATSSNTMMKTREQTHMPIKINSAGVIPVIFASSVLSAPRIITNFMETTDTTRWINTVFDYTQPFGFSLYILLIIVFAFFYANLQIDAHKISTDLKKNGGAVPGVRTGMDTENHIKRILNRVTVVGTLFLVIIAAIPLITSVIWSNQGQTSLTLGGTGLIIVTGVALETVKQIKTHITRKEYHGYIRR